MVARPHPRLAALATLLLLASAGAPARAELLSVQAEASPLECDAGDPIFYTLTIEADEDIAGIEPEPPDWGGLTLSGGPSHQMSTRYAFGGAIRTLQILKTFQYQLTAPSPGAYTIGPVRVRLRGQTRETQPIVVRVRAPDTSALPESVRGEPIVHPRTNDPGVNQQLKGRVFLRPIVANKTPYVGQPVLVSYYLYWDPQLNPVSKGLAAKPEVAGALVKEIFPPPNNPQAAVAPQSEVLDGRTYTKELVYQAFVTPTRPQEYRVDGLVCVFRLPVQGRRRPGFDPVFDDLFGGTLNNYIQVEARVGPVVVAARAVPRQADHPEFSGTVGSFEMRSSLDRDEAPEGEFVTMKLELFGEGNVSLAADPVFPDNPNFMLLDRVKRVDERPVSQGPGGTMATEFVMRPKRAGELKTPEIAYTIFDPKIDDYRTLKAEPRVVRVLPGERSRAAAAAAEGGAPVAGEPPPDVPRDEATGLRFLRPAIDVSRSRPAPLPEGVGYWAVQALAAALAWGAYARARRRDRVDPVKLRRERALAEFERKVRGLADGDGEKGTTALDRALRECFADRFAASADGLTREEIARRLKAEGVEETKAEAALELLDRCANARYAPGGIEAARVGAWSEEAVRTLREVFPRKEDAR